MSHYPAAIDSALVGTYPAHTKSGGGYFYDDVLEYRVWCRPWQGAPDEFDGEIYYYAFATYEQAKAFSDATAGSGVFQDSCHCLHAKPLASLATLFPGSVSSDQQACSS